MKIKENIKLDFNSTNSESYNDLITLSEIKHAIISSKNSAPGPDQITYNILKKLPSLTLQALEKAFNHIWTQADVPNEWHEALVFPIPKPGKSKINPENYRPISLTNTLCKIFEKLILN
ncbi:hypothetical protein HELRODRAFT_62922, partial [Helobdella robusta]|uniref:Reverse transcriptase domain-containing protein n=1 Tax=Helobdella robusta TaxID=6412 RepID=T1FX77_HELRO